MKPRFTSAEKLQIVLEHHLLSSPPSPHKNVKALCKRHGVSRQIVNQWRTTLLKRADTILADGRSIRPQTEMETECERLRREVQDLRRQLGDFDMEPDDD